MGLYPCSQQRYVKSLIDLLGCFPAEWKGRCTAVSVSDDRWYHPGTQQWDMSCLQTLLGRRNSCADAKEITRVVMFMMRGFAYEQVVDLWQSNCWRMG